jgi:myo-inositol-1(or 4)-monophosphatase
MDRSNPARHQKKDKYAMMTFLKETIVQAGKICLEEQKYLSKKTIEFKSKKDLVTQVDKKVEDAIIRAVGKKFPDHDVFGEESGRTHRDAEYLWIIDPIDGTTSYVHHHPFYCVSIAVYRHSKPFCAAVFAPELDELFVTSENTAFLNDRKIEVSRTEKLIEAVMATGFACLRSDLEHNNLPYFNTIVPQLRDIRRFGSAALDLCYVACGRLDGFWELNLNVYDVAAGAMMVTASGGRVTDFNGSDQFPANGIVAANSCIHNTLLDTIKAVR